MVLILRVSFESVFVNLNIANVENVENILYESIFVNAHLDGALNAGAHPLVLI